jgi:hypothetical protein
MALNSLLLLGSLGLLFLSPLSGVWVVVVFGLHLLRLTKWAGIFNGGSDFMTSTVGLGLCLELLHPKAGLCYVGLQLVLSYFVAGYVKLRNPEWRTGRALLAMVKLPGVLAQKSKQLSWALILFEVGVPLSLFWRGALPWVAGVSIFFHLLVFWFLGLNRFVWAWLAAWPSAWVLAEVISFQST